MIIAEYLKDRLNRGDVSNLYIWRDNSRNEIDLMLDEAYRHFRGGCLSALERLIF